MRLHRPLAPWLAPLLLLAATPRVASGQEPVSEPIAFRAGDAEISAEGGTIAVPMSRASAGSAMIELRYVRLPTTGASPGSPIVYLAGGPGGSGIAGMQGSRAEWFLSLREFGDVIALDQRGTGDSGPEARSCPRSIEFPLDEPADPDAWLGPLGGSVASCVDSLRALGTDARGFTTVESADDLEALRRALGAERLTLVGSSYGTHLALATARRHPESVDRMVLAGVEGPDHTLKLPGNIQGNLERVAEAIRRDPMYGPLLPDPLGTLDSLLRGLEAEPERVAILPGLEVTVGRWDLQSFLAGGMGDAGELARLPVRLVTMSRGDFGELARWAYEERRPGPVQLMSRAMDCASWASIERLERVRRESRETLLGATIDWPLPGICEVAGLPRLDDAFRGPLERSIPVLFVSGTLDGRTPVSNAEEIAAGFPEGRHLVIENASHGSDLFTSSPQILEAVHAFLAGEDLPFDRIELPPLEFAPYYERSIVSDVLERLERDGFATTAAWFEETSREHAGGRVYDLDEGVLNHLGYDLLSIDEVDRAIEVFRLSVRAHPEAFNPWDSLGEAYMIAGDDARAIENYEKSLELNPGNDNARRMLERIRRE